MNCLEKEHDIEGLPLDQNVQQKISRQWKLKEDDEKCLLKSIFPRLDLTLKTSSANSF